MRVLVTGFEPFGGEGVNPSWEVACGLPDTIAGAQVDRALVPVAFGRGPAQVADVVRQTQPDLVLSLGQAGGRAALTPELVGINLMDARIPDNDGNQPQGRRIVEEGPDAHFSTLPVREMAAAVAAAGIPAAVSYTAGTYVCNDLLYELLHLQATELPQVRAGFLHVPYLPQQAAAQAGKVPSMSLGLMVEGVTRALQVAIDAGR